MESISLNVEAINIHWEKPEVGEGLWPKPAHGESTSPMERQLQSHRAWVFDTNR